MMRRCFLMQVISGDLILAISKCLPCSYPHVPLAAQQNWDDLELGRI